MIFCNEINIHEPVLPNDGWKINHQWIMTCGKIINPQ